MNMNQSGRSIAKTILLFLAVFGFIPFCGGLAVSNWPRQMAESEAIREETNDERQLNEGTLAERIATANEELRAQREEDRWFKEERRREIEATNVRNRELRDRIATGGFLLGLIAVCAVLVIAAYGLLLAVHQSVERRTAARPAAVAAPARRAPARPSAAPRRRNRWNDDPAFRRMRRQEARRNEREDRRREAERREREAEREAWAMEREAWQSERREREAQRQERHEATFDPLSGNGQPLKNNPARHNGSLMNNGNSNGTAARAARQQPE